MARWTLLPASLIIKVVVCWGAQGEARGLDDSAASLLVLSPDGPAPLQALTDILELELRLVLDDVDVISRAAPSPGFADLGVGAQITELQARLSDPRIQGVIWLQPERPDGKMEVRVLLARSGHVLAHTREARATRAAVRKLALALRELVVAPWTHGPETWHRYPAPPAPTDESAGTAAPEPDPPPPPAALPTWELRAAAGFDNGISSSQGPSLLWSGGFALGRRLGAGGRVSGTVEGRFGPTDAIGATGRSEGIGVRAGVSLAYLFRFDPFTLGPWLGAQVEWHSLRTDDASAGPKTFDWSSPRIALGFDVRRKLADRMAIAILVQLGWRQHTQRIRRRSDSRVVLQTPRFDAGASLGLVWQP